MKMKKNKQTVSAIVPVFNEEKTVGGVIEALLNSDLITEVIGVNDGSEDKSLKALRSFGKKIKLVSYKKNRGKGFAMAKGVEKAKGEIVAFFDSDLLKLSQKHIKTVLEPILKGKAQAVLGYPQAMGENSKLFADLTGERVYFRERLLPYLKKLSKTTICSAEIFLNSKFKKNEMVIIPLKDLIHLKKPEKMELSCAIREYLKEGIELAQAIARREGLLPEDYQRLRDFVKVRTLQDFKMGIEKIKNKKIKRILRKYFLKYTNFAKRKLQDFL